MSIEKILTRRSSLFFGFVHIRLGRWSDSLLWGKPGLIVGQIWTFEANAKDGHGVDCQFATRHRNLGILMWRNLQEISGLEALGPPQLPDSHFLPPMGGELVEKQ